MNALVAIISLGLGSGLLGVGYLVSSDHVEYGSFDESSGFSKHVIEGADAATFKVLPDGDYAKDAHAAYWRGLRIYNADAASFQALSRSHAKDDGHAYFEGRTIEGADPTTFVEVTLQLARDKTRAYDGQAASN
jgi:hypothetical protein